MPDRSQKRIYCVLGKIMGKFQGKFCIFPEIFHFVLKMGQLFANYEKKKWKISGKISRNFLAIFPSVLDAFLSKMETSAQYKVTNYPQKTPQFSLSYEHCGRL